MAANDEPEFGGDLPLGDSYLDCHCHRAVMRAYAEMIAVGAPRTVALEAAVRVFRYHHPEVASFRAHDKVETWVHTGPLH
jgi:hypothetical protein